jgi:hypothetical protein
LQSFVSDLRHTLREFRARPTFTATAVLSLALGVGATTAVFSVIYAVLINPYPYRDAEHIVEIHLLDPQGNDRVTGYSGPEIAQLRQLKSFDGVVAMASRNLVTTDGNLPEDVRALSISADFPNYLGVPCKILPANLALASPRPAIYNANGPHAIGIPPH